jgi:hypothetical protein
MENVDNEKRLEVDRKRPHVVILGAGASVDTFPNGDKYGKKLPVMNNFLNTIGMEHILDGVTLKTTSNNLEDIYSELYDRGDECKNVRMNIENGIRTYFKSLVIPDTPTKYDLLLLSLTNKDCVASFNWDDLLLQAYNRVNKITNNLPELIFLHGNVSAGYCKECNRFGHISNICPKCEKPFDPVPLLYPVIHKDYNQNLFIRDEWQNVSDFLSRAILVTVYGYSAPKSDKEASNLLKKGFSRMEGIHKLDKIEIIERKGFDNENLSSTWRFFIKGTHGFYKIFDSFFNSLLAKAPRRTVEFYVKQNLADSWWGESKIQFKDGLSFDEIKKIVQPLILDEEKGIFEIL